MEETRIKESPIATSFLTPLHNLLSGTCAHLCPRPLSPPEQPTPRTLCRLATAARAASRSASVAHAPRARASGAPTARLKAASGPR